MLDSLPAGWTIATVGDLGEVRLGRQRSPQNETGSYMTPYLRVANVYDGFIDFSDVLEMNFTPREQEVYGVRNGDILVNEGQSRELVGRCAKYVGESGIYCFQNTLIRYRCSDLLDADFAYHMFSCWLRHGLFADVARQTTSIAHLGADRFAAMPMVFPPIREQREIVDVLRCTDEAIGASRRTVEKAELSRQALVSRLLTAGLSASGFREEYRGSSRLPLGWQRISIGDFAQVRRGASPRPIDDPAWFSDSGPGWVRIRDVTASGKYLRSTAQRLSPAGVARSVKVYPGQVIMSIAATVGEVIEVDMEACIHDGFVVIVPDLKVMSPDYLAMLLKFHQSDFVGRGQAGTQVNINGDIVKSVAVAVPPVSEQAAIVELVNSWDAQVERAEASLKKLERVKRSLADDLLGGRTLVGANRHTRS
ncbi:restriction endonuclease subunit S [Lentzea sp. CC55]|uniref:restriction endonuclease subunit S n=1 Tax=Lentzea sp. CC55 TaxID=2884909 RepID=UPI001F1FCE92|nr:restriction endonuclease subunit S [Lentzea sp. CC55]MCG8921436.1 restriction endonuclease subunit S [Lentzea sp. CC55]